MSNIDENKTDKVNTLKSYYEEVEEIKELVKKAKLKPGYKLNIKKLFPKALYANNGFKYKTCRLLEIHPSTLYGWLRDDPEFKKVIDEVYERLTDFLEAQLILNASQGKETSNIFALKNLRPDKWRDRKEVDFKGTITKEELDDAYSDSRKLISEAVTSEAVEDNL